MRRAVVAVIALSAHAAADHDVRIGGGHVPDGPDRALDLAISAGAGVDGFLGGTARERFAAGPSWNVRVGMLDRTEIRLELVYAGSSQEIAEGDGARLVAHGVYAQLRVNVAPRWVVEPFFYAGGGWTRWTVSGPAGDLETPDHILEIPFGFGLARRFGDFVVDARAGLSVASGADLVPAAGMTTSTESTSLHRFGVRANIGIDL
jgi:hypothetical protein